MSGRDEFRIVVSLGTDHHQFDRLVLWVDTWLSLYDDPPSCLVQHGSSRQPELAAGVDRLPRLELLSLYSRADIIIVQGGPGSIIDARECGHRPLAVPRRPELGEVVDGHQIAFTEFMHAKQEAFMVSSLQELIRLGDTALKEPASLRTDPRAPGGAAAAARLEVAVNGLTGTAPARINRNRIRQIWAIPRW